LQRLPVSDNKIDRDQIDADKRDALLALLRYARDELNSVDAAAQYFVEMAIWHISDIEQERRSNLTSYDEVMTIQ
jgi:hypothetical protein